MSLHTCAPPTDVEPRAQRLWVCPECGSVWEAAPDGPGIFDFDRNEVVTRAAWIRIDGPASLAG
jgi:hypothetical protein